MAATAICIALGCDVSESARQTNPPSTPARSGPPQEVTAAESWQEFQRRCISSETKFEGDELQQLHTALHEDVNLARTTVIWKHDRGSARERLPLIRSCARLGRPEAVLALLDYNLDTVLREEVVLDAIRCHKPKVVTALLESRLFEPERGFLGFALAQCGTAQSASCVLCLFNDERCEAQALQQCDHKRFGLPPWSHIRVLEKAIVKTVEAGSDDGSLPSEGGEQCLQLLANYATPHLQDEEWQRILRLAIVRGEEGPISALLRVCPRLLLQAERLEFEPGSMAAATQRILGFMHYVGLYAKDVK